MKNQDLAVFHDYVTLTQRYFPFSDLPLKGILCVCVCVCVCVCINFVSCYFTKFIDSSSSFLEAYLGFSI